MIFIFFIVSLQLKSISQDRFVKTNKTRPEKNSVISNQPSNINSALTSIDEKKSADDLYFNYPRLSDIVKNKISSNKSSGLPISKGIYKSYDVIWDAVQQLTTVENTFKSLTGFKRIQQLNQNKMKIIVSPLVPSETIKETCKKIDPDFTLDNEFYFTE